MQNVTIAGPATGEVGVSYAYTITVGPDAATAPFAYEVTYTDGNAPLMLDSSSTQISASLGWAAPGIKEVAVSVTNDLGTVTTTLEVTITDPNAPGEGEPALYLPLIQK
jgi:hypothetical protein